GVEQVDHPVAGRVTAAHDHHTLALEDRFLTDDVVGAAALPGRHVVAGQLLRLKGAVTAGHDHGPRSELSAIGVKHDHTLLALALPRDRPRGGVQVHRDVE